MGPHGMGGHPKSICPSQIHPFPPSPAVPQRNGVCIGIVVIPIPPGDPGGFLEPENPPTPLSMALPLIPGSPEPIPTGIHVRTFESAHSHGTARAELSLVPLQSTRAGEAPLPRKPWNEDKDTKFQQNSAILTCQESRNTGRPQRVQPILFLHFSGIQDRFIRVLRNS